jgi:small subunit ribosomal protein S17
MSRHKRWTIAEVLSHSPKADKSAESAAPAPEAAAKEVSE